MSRLENGLKVTIFTQSANFFFLTPQKLPDPQFQSLKVKTSIPSGLPGLFPLTLDYPAKCCIPQHTHTQPYIPLQTPEYPNMPFHTPVCSFIPKHILAYLSHTLAILHTFSSSYSCIHLHTPP